MNETRTTKEMLLDALRKKLPQGTTIYTVRVGKSFSYVVLCIDNGTIQNITQWALRADDRKPSDHYTLSGTGYNHAGAIVETLSYTLYGKPDALKHEML